MVGGEEEAGDDGVERERGDQKSDVLGFEFKLSQLAVDCEPILLLCAGLWPRTVGDRGGTSGWARKRNRVWDL